jgi:shikimate kinase
MARNIFFVGPMGAGKTTIGRQLAKQLKREFYDSDREVERRTGATIPLIFELEQEEGFRKREQTVIDELTQMDNIVLATGGGAVLASENREHLCSRGYVIYLYAPISQLLRRTSHDKNRPLLQTENPRQKLEQLMAVRDPLYRQVADTVIKTDNLPVKQVIKQIIELARELKL